MFILYLVGQQISLKQRKQRLAVTEDCIDRMTEQLTEVEIEQNESVRKLFHLTGARQR